MQTVQEASRQQRRHAKSAAVRTRKKSAYSAQDETLAIIRASLAVRYVNMPQPVILGMECLGWVRGHEAHADTLWYPWRVSLDKLWANYSHYESVVNAHAKARDAYSMAGYQNYDQIIAGNSAGQCLPTVYGKSLTTNPVANNWYDIWVVGGNPTSGTYTGSASSSLQFTDASTGALATGGNVSPQTKHLQWLHMLATAGVPCPIIQFGDRCVDYQLTPYNNNAINTLTQSNSPVSLRYSTNSDSGCRIAITMQQVASATQQSFTQLSYTDQSGNTAQAAPCSTTTTNIIPSAAAPTAALGARIVSPSAAAASTLVTSPYFPLASGDTGVQQITSFTNNAIAINTGKMDLVMFRPLFILPMATAGVASMIDAVNMISSLERVFDGACINMFIYFPVATNATLQGGIYVGWN